MSSVVYRFTVWNDGRGRDFARCGDLEATSRASAICALARKIVALDSVPDGRIEAYSARTGRLSTTHPSLYRQAALTLIEDDRGIRYAPWKPNPMAERRKTTHGERGGA